jgi:hypothetical protein
MRGKGMALFPSRSGLPIHRRNDSLDAPVGLGTVCINVGICILELKSVNYGQEIDIFRPPDG